MQVEEAIEILTDWIADQDTTPDIEQAFDSICKYVRFSCTNNNDNSERSAL